MAWQDRGPLEMGSNTQQTNTAQPYNTGSFLLGLLPGGSLIDKGLRGEQITGGDVATEAALSLIPFGLGKVAKGAKTVIGAAKGARVGAKTGEGVAAGARIGANIANQSKPLNLTSSIGKNLENIGTKALGIQTAGSLGKDIASKAPQTLQKLSRYGITDVNKFADEASKITGREGAVNLEKMRILATVPKTTQIGNWVEDSLKPLSTSVGLTPSDTKAITNAIRTVDNNILNGVSSRVTGRAVNIGEAHPEDLYKGYQELMSLAGVRPLRTATDAARTKYEVLSNAANKLKDLAFKGVGTQPLSAISKSDIIADLRSRGLNNANLIKDVMGAKTLDDLNKIESTFVNASKIAEDVTSAASARSLTGSASSIKDAAMSALVSPASRAVGGIASGTGRALQNVSPVVGALGAQAGVRLGADALGVRGGQTQPSLDEALLQQSGGGFGQQGGQVAQSNPFDQGQSNLEQPQQQTNPYPRENLLYDIQRDPENADKYIAYYQQLQEVFAPATDSSLSQSNQNALASSDNATNTLDQLEQLYSTAGGGSGRVGGFFQNLFGSAGIDKNANIYNSLSQASVTQIAKALAGSGAGTVSDADARVIIAALPTLQDSPEEAKVKFAALRQRLQAARDNTLRYGQGGTTPGTDLQSALLQAQQGGGF